MNRATEQRALRWAAEATRSRPTPVYQAGFTIIEVLVGIMLFSVIILVIITPLTGLFSLTKRSDQQTSATQTAQRIIETVRGEWLSGANYSQVCVMAPLPPISPALQVSVKSLDQQGNVSAVKVLQTTCGIPADNPPLRRVEVTVKVGQAVSSLSVDVARP